MFDAMDIALLSFVLVALAAEHEREQGDVHGVEHPAETSQKGDAPVPAAERLRVEPLVERACGGRHVPRPPSIRPILNALQRQAETMTL
jgi:hypothetical protein